MTSNSGWRGNSPRRESARPSRPQPDWKTAGAKGAAGQPRRVNKKKLLGPVLAIVALIIISKPLWDPATPLRTASVFLNLLEKPADFENQLGFRTPPTQKNTDFQHFQVVEPNELEKRLEADNFRNDHVVLVLLQTHLIPISVSDFACVTKGTVPDLIEPRKFSDVMNTVNGIRNSGKQVLLMVDCPTARADWRTDLPGCDLRSFFEKYFDAAPAGKNSKGSLTIVCSAAISGDGEPASPYAEGRTRLSYAFQKSFSREAAGKDEDLSLQEFLTKLQKSFEDYRTPGTGFHSPQLMILGQNSKDEMGSSPEQIRDYVLFRKMQQEAPQITPPNYEPGLLLSSRDLWTKMEKENFASRWPEQWNSITEQLVWAERAYFQGRNGTAEELIKVAGARLDQALKQQQQTVAAAAESENVAGSLKELTSRLEAAYRNHNPGHDGKRYVTLRSDFESAVEECEQQKCVHLLYGTLLHVHQQLLEAEDRSFSLRADDRLVEKRVEELEKSVASLKSFAQAYGEAFQTADRALRILPGTAFWCSKRSTLPTWASSEPEWLPHLQRLCDHSSGLQSRQKVDDLAHTLKELPDAPPSDLAHLSAAAREIRSHAILSLAYSRGLLSELDKLFREPGEQSQANVLLDSLADRTKDLEAWTAKTAQELKSLEDKMREAIEYETSTPMQDPKKQSLQHAFLYEALPLTFIGAEQRGRIHETLRKLGKTASGLDALQSSEDKVMQRGALIELRWAAALSSLLVNSPEEHRKRLAEIAMKDTLLHDDIAEASAKLRSLWSEAGTEVKASYDNVERDAYSRAVSSSLFCRLLTKYDLPDVGKRPHSIVDRVSVLNRLESHLLQADLITQSGWCDDSEKWYQTTSEKSLEQFSALAKTTKLPSVLGEQEQQIQQQLTKPYELELSSGDKMLRLGSYERHSDWIIIDVQATLPNCVKGAGAVRFEKVDKSIPEELFQFGNNDEPQTIELKSPEPMSLKTTITRTGSASETGCEYDIPVQVFFRGRMWSQDTPLKISACSPIEYTTTLEPRSEKAVISVDGKDPHPVVFVLDWSDSMKEELQPGGQQRYQAAADTLKLLAQNSNLRESKIYLRVFGHRTRQGTGEKIPEYTGLFKKPNNAGDANEDTEQEFEGRLSDPAKLQEFIETIKRLEELRIGGKKQTGITPLLQSIIEALVKDLKNGPGTVIAITDGEPTDDGLPVGSNEAIKWDKRKPLENALISNNLAKVKIVAFDIAAQQLEPLRQTFVNDTRFEKFKDRIELINATDTSRLSKALSDGLDPRPFIASDSRGDQPPTQLGGTIAVDPGLWRVRMENSKSVNGDPRFRLTRGDTLKLNYEFSSDNFVLIGRQTEAKELWSKQNLEDAAFVGPTRVMGNAKEAGDSSQVNVSVWLERSSPAEFVEQPAEIEIQVAANGHNKPLMSIKQTYDSSEGVPGWKLECSEWPPQAQAKVTVAWKMTRTAPDVIVPCDTAFLSAGNAESAKPLTDSNLPGCRVWYTDLMNTKKYFEVRVDPEPGRAISESNPVNRIRVELGKRNTVGEKETFTPWELLTEVIRVDESVIFRFYSDKQLTADSIQNSEIAFTSLKSRRDAAVLAEDLDIDVN